MIISQYRVFKLTKAQVKIFTKINSLKNLNSYINICLIGYNSFVINCLYSISYIRLKINIKKCRQYIAKSLYFMYNYNRSYKRGKFCYQWVKMRPCGDLRRSKDEKDSYFN